MRLLREFVRPGRLVVVATHDDRFLEVADRLVHPSLRAGRLMSVLPARGTPLWVLSLALVPLFAPNRWLRLAGALVAAARAVVLP